MFGYRRVLHACPIVGCAGGTQCDPNCTMPDRLIPQTQLYISTKADNSTGLHLVGGTLAAARFPPFIPQVNYRLLEQPGRT
jgi:hypothetical protein